MQELENADEEGPNVFDEFLSEVESHDTPHDQWTEADKVLLKHCLGLMKVTRSLVKKSLETIKKRGKCYKLEYVTQLDTVSEMVKKASPAIDELSSNIYPPLECVVIQQNVSRHLIVCCHLIFTVL